HHRSVAENFVRRRRGSHPGALFRGCSHAVIVTGAPADCKAEASLLRRCLRNIAQPRIAAWENPPTPALLRASRPNWHDSNDSRSRKVSPTTKCCSCPTSSPPDASRLKTAHHAGRHVRASDSSSGCLSERELIQGGKQ